MNPEVGQWIGHFMSALALLGLARVLNKLDAIDKEFKDCIHRREYDQDSAEREEYRRDQERWKREYVSVRFHRLGNVCHALYGKVWPDREPPNLNE